MQPPPQSRRPTLEALVAVTTFAATLPLTRVALEGFAPLPLTFGRLLGAALLAAVALLLTGAPAPKHRQFMPLLAVAVGGVFGFPLLAALALEHHPAAPGAIPLALLPLITAGWARLRGHERPAPAFWLWALAGSGAVLHFAWGEGAEAVAPEMYGAAAMAALAYAEGGRLAREMPGWQVMAWALLLASPGAALGFGYSWAAIEPPATMAPWLALAFLAAIPQFGAFWFWYRALAAGVARASQVQLLQPFFTLLLAAAFLGETIPPTLWLYAAGVVVAVHFARHAPALPTLRTAEETRS